VRSRISCGFPGQPADRATFSATVRAGTEVKCWCTIPMPSTRAARGLATRRTAPLTMISPASGRTRP
jgi:hypothetical protein